MIEEIMTKIINEHFTTFISSVSGLVGVIVGSMSAGIFNFLQNKSQQKSEERKHLASLTVTAAIKHWERIHEGRDGEHIMPIDIYMVHMSKLANEVLSSRITKNNIAKKLRNIDEIVDEMKKYAYSTAKKMSSQQSAQPDRE